MVDSGPAEGHAVSRRGLSKDFGPVRALHKLDLNVAYGQTFGLIGPNGAGKTTAIRLWLGLTRPTAGTAEVLGHPIPPRTVLPRIGYLPQALAVYEDLTVAENLTLFGRLMGMAKDAIGRRIEEMLSLVELEERRDDLVSTLSGGMKRRASLAATLLHDPDLLLLDEPTVGVDPELRDDFWRFFGDLTARGKTVLITTHYMEEASRCDDVGLLFRGELLAQDEPAAIEARTGAENLEEAFLRLVRGGERG